MPAIVDDRAGDVDGDAAPGFPAGCLIVSGDAGTPDEGARHVLHTVRDQQIALIAERIRVDVAVGVIDRSRSGDPTPAALARYAMAVVGGIAQQAREGVPLKKLNDLAAVATQLWSSVRREFLAVAVRDALEGRVEQRRQFG